MTKHTYLTKYQTASIKAIREHIYVPYVFLIGGFGCGKSFTDVQLILFLYQQYKHYKDPIQIGVFGVTIKLLKQTVIADVERAFDQMHIAYKDNSQAGTLTVGNITFVYLAMQYPDGIYAFNFTCCLVDEIDELPPEKVSAVVKAVQERNRINMPASGLMPARDPFVFFSTTAQGMGGTYNLVRQFDKNKVPYIIIRGKTEDNPALSKQQVALLRKLYTEDEARAYLDGEFVNLAQGRVYPQFNRKLHVCMRFPLLATDTAYVGQDFNLGFHATAECICRNGKIYVYNSHHWNDMAQGLRRLRELYPQQRIVMIPDASGKEIMSGFVEEANQYGIEIHWNNQNCSIMESVMAVNKAFMLNQLAVMEPINERSGMRGTELKDSLLDRIVLGLETQDFDDSGKPRKGKGPEALDHGMDSLRYAVWHILHTITGFEKILTVLKGVNYNKEKCQ